MSGKRDWPENSYRGHFHDADYGHRKGCLEKLWSDFDEYREWSRSNPPKLWGFAGEMDEAIRIRLGANAVIKDCVSLLECVAGELALRDRDREEALARATTLQRRRSTDVAPAVEVTQEAKA